MKSAKSKRQFTLLTLVVALGVAVYLNWEYAKTDAPFALQDPGAVSANAAVETVTDGTTSGVLDALPVQEALPDKNYGDAQLVSANETSNDKYFEQARLTRSKTRDEALDTMPVGRRLVYATHGHVHNLKNLPPLAPGDVLLHGHTHIPAWTEFGEGNLYLNPGSVSIPKEGSAHSYMTLEGETFLWKTLEGEVYRELEL